MPAKQHATFDADALEHAASACCEIYLEQPLVWTDDAEAGEVAAAAVGAWIALHALRMADEPQAEYDARRIATLRHAIESAMRRTAERVVSSDDARTRTH